MSGIRRDRRGGGVSVGRAFGGGRGSDQETRGAPAGPDRAGSQERRVDRTRDRAARAQGGRAEPGDARHAQVERWEAQSEGQGARQPAAGSALEADLQAEARRADAAPVVRAKDMWRGARKGASSLWVWCERRDLNPQGVSSTGS